MMDERRSSSRLQKRILPSSSAASRQQRATIILPLFLVILVLLGVFGLVLFMPTENATTTNIIVRSSSSTPLLPDHHGRRRLVGEQPQPLQAEDIVVVTTTDHDPHTTTTTTTTTSNTTTTTTTTTTTRPIIWTYYEKAKTDMTDEADIDLLENWKKAWYDAGWEPKICTQQDAMRVPEYSALMDLIVDPDFIGEYNVQCYIRWIAMAGVTNTGGGGGWMADYDTFPLHHFLDHGRYLPNNGKLTVYGKFVPALVSGLSHEYLKMAKWIGESIHRKVYEQKYINQHSTPNHYKNQLPWSDMMALRELYYEDEENNVTTSFIAKEEVFSGIIALQVGHDFEPKRGGDCELTNGMRAIHFSHRAIQEGKQAYRGAIHRGTIARKFLNMWNARCPKMSLSTTTTTTTTPHDVVSRRSNEKN